MLAILLSLLFCSGIHAQNFSSYPIGNNEYGKIALNQFKVTDATPFYAPADPTIDLTMDCLAANGYGQWTCSSQIGSLATTSDWFFSPNQPQANSTLDASFIWDFTTQKNGWFLLGNLIGRPSMGIDFTIPGPTATHPGCQPPGIVSGGTFKTIDPTSVSGTNGCKVTANLGGSVRYVQIEPTARTTFLIEGLNDERGSTPFTSPTASGDQQIDISLAGTNPKPPQIVTQPIFSYTAASTSGHAVISTEPDFRDAYDVAQDGVYEYIVWTTTNATYPSTSEVWATAILLADGTIASSSYPMKVSQGTSLIVDNATRPTVACDVRNNPSAPDFYVAYISGNAYINAAEISGTIPIFNHFEPLPNLFYSPSGVLQPGYSSATHARILVSTVAGSSTPEVSIYALVAPLTTGIDYHLILYKALNWSTDKAKYVDGVINNGSTKSYPLPITNSTTSLKGILDKYIIAFVNPYDNQDLTNGFIQYHCLYQPDYTTYPSGVQLYNPLILIRGSDGINTGSPDTRVLLNQDSRGILDDPSSYCGAVNQMGVHVHWRTLAGAAIDPNTHFYVRDSRSFDEPIEENTLITNVCTVADGSAHGGTSGAYSIGFNRKIAIWTDPNYGLNNSFPSSGLYFASNYYSGALAGLNKLMNIGTLQFSATAGVIFGLVGTPFEIPDGSGPGNLFTAPNINISFNASGQKIDIEGNSTWDFYGTSQTNCFSNPSDGTIWLDGSQLFDGDTARGKLNIHPGGQFFGQVPFYSDFGDVEIQFAANIFPLTTSGSANTNASGLFIDDNIATLTDSKVNSYLPQSEFINVIRDSHTDFTDVVMEILGYGAGTNSSVYSLNSTTTDYSNYAPLSAPTFPGAAVVLYYGGCESGPDKVTFNGGSFNRMRFHATEPKTAGLEINNMTITGINQFMIHIQRTCSFNDYSDILISSNTFENILISTPFDPDFCIRIEGFNSGSRYGELNINDNILYSSANQKTGFSPLADGAIELINSTGNIEGNQIEGAVFNAGITLTSNDGNTTRSYLCSNTISGLTALLHGIGTGIISDHYIGYAKLETISGCDLGYQSGSGDHPGLFFSSIINSTGAGITTTNGSAIFDMSGAHGATSSGDDYAAFNTISGNGTAQSPPTQVSLDGSSHIEYGHRLEGWGWTQQGENNTIGIDNSDHSDRILISATGGGTALGDIDKNWWGVGVDPVRGDVSHAGSSAGLWDAGRSKVYCLNITYDLPANTSTGFNTTAPSSDSTASGTSVDCSGSFTAVRSKGSQPLSVMDNIDTCQRWHSWLGIRPTSQDEYKMQYDSLRRYIESCGKNSDSYDAFTGLPGAVQFMSNDTSRFGQFRTWLISVLYLNTTQPYYFCACMEDIAGTYQYSKYDPLGYLAVINYIRENNSLCWSPGDSAAYVNDSLIDFQDGYDPTHLPSLDSLGLGFLLHKNGVPSQTALLPSTYLASFTSSPNPFIKATTLEFTLNRMSYVTLSVYDELGRLVWGDGRGSSLEAGTHDIQIDGSSLPSGTLYARIATGFGEVKTVKLVHEK